MDAEVRALPGGLPPRVQQRGLFEVLPPSLDTGFSTAQRVDLDANSWIEHVPGWMTGSDILFEELLASAPWEQRSRWMYTQRVIEPRLTAEYPDLLQAPEVLLHEVAGALSSHYRQQYRALWLNLYRDERDSTGWHADRIGRVEAQSIVPVLSLGATRRFLIQAAEGGRSVSFHAAAGDLLVMGGRCQRDWRHCVPKQAAATGPRVSINFSTARR